MDFVLKNIDIKQKTAKITLDRLNLSNNDNCLKALAILLGGYNEFGRNINLENHRENMIIFKDLLEKIEAEIS